jgi:hypothetical protein
MHSTSVIAYGGYERFVRTAGKHRAAVAITTNSQGNLVVARVSAHNALTKTTADRVGGDRWRAECSYTGLQGIPMRGAAYAWGRNFRLISSLRNVLCCEVPHFRPSGASICGTNSSPQVSAYLDTSGSLPFRRSPRVGQKYTLPENIRDVHAYYRGGEAGSS